MLFQGPIHELQQYQQQGLRLLINTSDNDAAIKLLQEYLPVKEGDSISIPLQDKKQVASVQRILLFNNLEVYLLQPKEKDLEQLFIDLIYRHS
jgi:ABC-2 type transport system ATP-binding protein